MSRAFTKEDDASEDLPELPIPLGPNYMTPRGLAMMQAAGCELVARKAAEAAKGGDLRPIDRDLRYLEARMNSAILVPTGAGPEARFGAMVTIETADDSRQSFQIVGEDEARSDSSCLSWSSPLASAMFGAKAGDTISWERPDTVVRAKIIGVEYFDHPTFQSRIQHS